MKISKREKLPKGVLENNRLILRVGLYVVLIFFALVIFFPFLWLVSSSLKPEAQIFIMPPRLIPRGLYIGNFIRMIREYPFLTWYFNSILLVAMRLGLSLFFCSLGGFALAKYNFPFKNLISLLVVSSLMIPFQLLIIPLFLTLYYLGLINTRIGVILPWAASPFGIFMMRQYYISIPDEFIDAAQIDGATGFWIYLHIMLPLGKAALGTLAVVLFVWTWISFIWPLVILFSPEKYPLPLGLANMVGGLSVHPIWGEILAGAVMATFPVVILFVFIQRYYIRGLTLGGLK